MDAGSAEQRIIDTEQLRLLRLGYFISAGTTGFFAVFGVLYMVMGMMFGVMSARMPHPAGKPPPPEFIGWVFAGIGFVITALCATVALLKLRMARCLRERSSLRFCRFVAALTCLEIPYGTALGVLSFTLLSRASVVVLFQRAAAEAHNSSRSSSDGA